MSLGSVHRRLPPGIPFFEDCEEQLHQPGFPFTQFQNFHEDCEAMINKQINMEFYASYVYLSMVTPSV